MPEIMPSEARNVRPPQQLRPRRLESGLYSKDMLTAARLFAPASEHTHSLLIQSDVTEPLTTITLERIESWKTRRLNAGRSATTVLRDLFTLSSVPKSRQTRGTKSEIGGEASRACLRRSGRGWPLPKENRFRWMTRSMPT
jgi:hypothetical protein